MPQQAELFHAPAYAPAANLSPIMGFNAGDRLYSPGPLYHNAPFSFTQRIQFVGGSAVLNENFDADKCFCPRTLFCIWRACSYRRRQRAN